MVYDPYFYPLTVFCCLEMEKWSEDVRWNAIASRFVFRFVEAIFYQITRSMQFRVHLYCKVRTWGPSVLGHRFIKAGSRTAFRESILRQVTLLDFTVTLGWKCGQIKWTHLIVFNYEGCLLVRNKTEKLAILSIVKHEQAHGEQFGNPGSKVAAIARGDVHRRRVPQHDRRRHGGSWQ